MTQRNNGQSNATKHKETTLRVTQQLVLYFFVICLFLLVHSRYNIKEVNLLITVYSIYTAYNLTKSRKKREVTIDKTLLGMSYIKQGNSTYIKDFLEVLIYNTLHAIYDLQSWCFMLNSQKTCLLYPYTVFKVLSRRIRAYA